MLSKKVSLLPGVGDKTETKLSKLGIKTFQDLLFYFPRTYKNLSEIKPIATSKEGEECTFEATVQSIETRKSFRRRRMAITEALIGDKTGSIPVIWFNQPYLSKTLKIGNIYLFNGKVKLGRMGLQLQSPTFEPIKKDQTHIGRIVPIYPATEGITPRMLRFYIKTVIDQCGAVKETLGEDTLKRNKLLNLDSAIREIHFPTSKNNFIKARERLAFEELLPLQIEQLKRKLNLSKFKSHPIKSEKSLLKSLLDSLPFELTDAQKKATNEILKDISQKTPMNRLLNGDVGSGKTIVAISAMLMCAKSGFQSALMAPTEILAKQHFDTLSKLLDQQKINIALITSDEIKSTNSNFKDIKKAIQNGDIKIIIGTHALIQKSLEFSDLALVIIDEQHRFGVEQRKVLRDKTPETIPHVLSMTATPIPRTLTLALYGDLDISILDELPKDRKPVKTYFVQSTKRRDAYNFIKKEISKGGKVFVVCPIIEESDKLGVKSATEEYKKLKELVFPELQIGLLHGKMEKQEKDRIINLFRLDSEPSIDILVTTAVVEVGVDIPRATVMMIEGAERFGLAQLHQFRGRVGRSDKQSYCLLFTDSDSDNTKKRLKSFVSTNDGFKLANLDLSLRGPGEIFGVEQHGFIDLRFASLLDLDFIKKVRNEATKLIEEQGY